jgi:hypothetical protein
MTAQMVTVITRTADRLTGGYGRRQGLRSKSLINLGDPVVITLP